MRPRGKRLQRCKQIQKWLYDYLRQDLDPYDFGGFIADYHNSFLLEGKDVPVDLCYRDGEVKSIDALSPERYKQFVEWLKDNCIPGQWMDDDPYNAPAYLFLEARSMLPDETWLIHFTNESPFRSFDRGATLSGLHLSTWNKHKEIASCPDNLSDAGISETVFGFAFEVFRSVLWHGKKYGRNAVLFQCDCAVSAFHYGDEEYQALFPLCSEYRAIPIYDVHGEFLVQTRLGRKNESETHFNSIEALIQYADARQAARRGLAGS